MPVPLPPATLRVGPFAQRRSDRYTVQHGLPPGRALAVSVSGSDVCVRTEAGASEYTQGRWTSVEDERAHSASHSLVPGGALPAGEKLLSAAEGAGGRVWLVTDRGAYCWSRDECLPVIPPATAPANQPPVPAQPQLTCVAVDTNGTVWFGSTAGVFATDGAGWWNVIDRGSGLPYEDVTCIALAPGGELWVGTTEGVCRYAVATGWQHYWGPRWLPHNHVNAIAIDATGAAWVATDGGIARLYDAPMTLEEKAAHYQQITEDRHNRRGFVTGARLRTPGDPTGGVVHEASDNDGLWTAVYVAAQSFRFAATGAAEAREAAWKSMRAMLDLVRCTGISGFPARALVLRGEEVDGYDPVETVRVPGETEKIWFESPVDASVLCKGDTSSDELDGHYFAWCVYHDLVASPDERKAIAETVAAVTDHLLENDLCLVGHTGRRTRWGVYAPARLNDDPSWWEERGLNSLSILAYLKVAEHICGDPRYAAKYRELIERHHYLLNTVRQKVAEPWYGVNHSDDQMAFMMYYCLLKLEQDPATQLILLQSLERSWQIERPEASPFFNIVYGVSTGRPCDLEAAVGTLQDWPWELIDWQVRGTHRHDVTVRTREGEGQTRVETTRVLPPSERRLMRWNGNPYQCDGGSPDGAAEEDGSAWLLPYWMARHHGLIQ